MNKAFHVGTLSEQRRGEKKDGNLCVKETFFFLLKAKKKKT